MTSPQNNQQATKPPPLPPPQQAQQQPYYAPYPYNNPFYYAYCNAYAQQQQSGTNNPNPPPPPPPLQYNPYYSLYAHNASLNSTNPLCPSKQNVSFTWNRTANNPPPPPPKPLISPKPIESTNTHKQSFQQMVSSSSSSWNNHTNESNHNKESHRDGNEKKATHPPALTKYFEKCLNRLNALSPEIATAQNRDKLQKQLKMRFKEARKNDNVFTIDWNNEAFPALLRHLISISRNSASISPKKRKANFVWNDHAVIRKVAKTSISHRRIHQKHEIETFLEDSPPPSFVSTYHKDTKTESDMSCSPESTPEYNGNKNKKQFIVNSIQAFGDESEDDHTFVTAKGRGFMTRKMQKNTRTNKKKKKKDIGFRWDSLNGVESLNTKNKSKDDLNEISRILERKKRFESQVKEEQNGNGNNWSTTNKKKKKSSVLNGMLSRDMQQMMEWHEKRVVGTCTKVEKDYFRLTSEPNPNEVRTLDTMRKTFNLLMIRWKTKNKKDYLYVGGQFKSLRLDLRVQHIRNTFSVKVYESNARICLEVGDLSEYNQCQGQLKELYREQEVFGDNYIEFLSYRLLYEAVTKNFYGISCIIKMEKEYCKEEEIANTLKIITAIQRMDYNTFFKLYKQLRHHGQCILNQIIYKVRYHALCRISVSYCPSTYPVNKLSKLIGFENEIECIKYLRNTGCVLQNNNNGLMLNCKISRGKIKEFIPKSEDDELGVTHGSVYHDKNQDETTITKFLRKT